MNWKIFIILFLQYLAMPVGANNTVTTDFSWGNSHFFNLNVGESISFKDVEVKLLQVKNHFNQFKVGTDTIWLKVVRGSLPEEINGIRIFVADNQKVKQLTNDDNIHSLLQKDVLVCLSDVNKPLLDPERYVFPVSFNDGFRWNAEEESYPFSFYRDEGESEYRSYPGLGIDLHNARGLQKHWLTAIENSRVVWIDSNDPETGILLESESQPGIYYVYSKLYTPNLAVKKGQKLVRGQVIGTAWGDKKWGHTVISVVKPETEPTPDDSISAAINCFPQLYGLYFQQGNTGHKFFSRGRITFGRPAWVDGNRPNIRVYEDFYGKGWIFKSGNPADKVERVTRGDEGHVRLRKIMFDGTPARYTNPDDYYEYRLNVRNGTYRIRAKVGDFYLPSWQKVEFEGVHAYEKSLDQGKFDWTTECVVIVSDGTLSIKIYIDQDNTRVAGLSEIVFQQVF